MDWFRYLGTFLALLIFTVACTVSADESQGPSQVGIGPGVLFRDDFSDSDSGWDQVRDDTVITDYENGRYRIFVNETSYDVWANPGQVFSDMEVEVTAQVVGGPIENDFGLICRYQDAGNFYVFLIGSDGFWGIGAVEDGVGPQLIGMEKMEFSSVINKGQAVNKIRADCVGETLTLYINGTIVETVRDNRFPSGDIGLIAGTFSTPGTDILFDDLVVRSPE